LRVVRANTEGVAARGTPGCPDREQPDFLRRGYVAIQECRREISDRHIVKALTGVVFRQQLCGIDLQRPKVADDILVFCPVESPESFGSAGIRMPGGSAVQRV